MGSIVIASKNSVKAFGANLEFSRAFILGGILLCLAVAVFFYFLRGMQAEQASRANTAGLAGKAAYKKGDFDKAIRQLEQAVDSAPEDIGNINLLGQSYEAAGRLGSASKAYRASLNLSERQEDVLYRMAMICKYRGRTDQTEGYLERVLDINSKNVPARMALAEIYAEQKHTGRAEAIYKALLKEKPFGLDLALVSNKLQEVR